MNQIYAYGLAIFIFLSGSSFAQNYTPMVVEDAHWILAYGGNSSTPYSSVTEFYSSGDTSFNGHSYKKIFGREIESISNNYLPPFQGISQPTLGFLLREDTVQRKVFGYQLFGSCPTNETLFFDFSLAKDDSILTECPPQVPLRKVDESYRAEMIMIPTPDAIWPMWDNYIQFTDSVTIYEFWNFGGNISYIWEGIGTHRGVNFSSSGILIYYCRGGDCNPIVTSNSNSVKSSNSFDIILNESQRVIKIEKKGIPKPLHLYKVEMFDLLGKRQSAMKWDFEKYPNKDIPTSIYPTGFYYLKISHSNDFPFVKKILINN